MLAVALVCLTAAACITLPLFVYGTALAAFGLPHVFAELRYVALRFAGRWPSRLVGLVGGLLAAIVALRILQMSDVMTVRVGKPAELGLVAVLAAVTLPALWRRGPLNALLGLVIIAGVAWGAAEAPLHTALLLAVLHNFTPVGFFYEALQGAKRRRALFWSGVLFLGVPALIATGLPYQALHGTGWVTPEMTVLPTGPLARHIGVYVPKMLHGEMLALHLFTAVVFAQCMHYAAVIHVLPRLGATSEGVSRSWAIGLGVMGALTLIAFAGDFFMSRKIYGMFAAVHAWIEVPILLAALFGAAPTPVIPEAAPG